MNLYFYCSISLLALNGRFLLCNQQESVPSTRQLNPHVISWFFRPEHFVQDTQYTEAELATIIGTIRSSQQNLIQQHRLARIISGIPILYKGLITLSNENGQVLLPRLQESETIIVIVTERPMPVLSHGNTIDYWKIKNSLAAAWYTCTRLIEGKQGRWVIEETSTSELRIPPDAIIILAPPTTIMLKEGSWPTDTHANLILPDIYVRDNMSQRPLGLNQIPVSRFFESTKYLLTYAPEDTRYSVIVI